MEPREKYHQELESLRASIQEMAKLSIEQLYRGLEAIETGNKGLAKKVIAADQKVDAFQLAIDDTCVKLIATEQPVAGDLREIVSSIKIVSSIARIGDHAKHLAKGTKRLSDVGRQQFFPIIKNMAMKGIRMLEIAIEAFVQQDISLANAAASLDNEIDDLKKSLSKKVIAFMKGDPENIEEGTNILFLNRFMERLGDHVANLCECVHFAGTGEHIDLN